MGEGDTTVHVLFALYGDFGPDEVTKQLLIDPTRTFRSGDLVGTGHTGRVQDESGWIVETDPQLGDTIDPHLDWLLNRLEPVALALSALRERGARTRLDCAWSSVGMSGGPWVTAEKMRRLAHLDLDLIISFYAVD